MHINKASISMNFWSTRASSTFIHTPFKQQLFDLGGHLEFILSKKFFILGVSLILAIFPWPWPRTKSWNLHMLSRLLYASIFWFYGLATDTLANFKHQKLHMLCWLVYTMFLCSKYFGQGQNHREIQCFPYIV